MPRLEEWEIKKYWEIFQGLSPVDNKLTGDRVSPVLKNSRLKDDQLSQIWDLSDIDNDGKLDFEEFCITMRLIFDLVNGLQGGVPTELPAWLIPSSKAHLIHANQAVATGNNNYRGLSTALLEDDDDDQLSDDFDWYISPTDKAAYETIYAANSDSYGRVTYDSLSGLYQTLRKVPQQDIASAWNLVNPKLFETIDKDQVLVFLHMLNQRENGKRMPRGVPASLRATFLKEVPTYDLNRVLNSVLEPSANNKLAFGNSYLSKMGQANNAVSDRGTDFSATEGTDWEKVRLWRELANLEGLLEKVQKNASSSNGSTQSDSQLIKYEYEQLLKYKQDKLTAAQSATGNGDKDLADVKNDIDLIESQVATLQEFLQGKEAELVQLKNEILSLKA